MGLRLIGGGSYYGMSDYPGSNRESHEVSNETNKIEKKAEKEQFINDVLSESIQRVAGFYLHILKELNKPDGVSFLGPTEYPEPYFGISESGARLNYILEIKEQGLVVCKTRREGKAYRHTYRIAEEYRNAMEKFLEKLGL